MADDSDPKANWPFQLEEEKAAPWPFQLEEPPAPSPARRVLETIAPPLQKTWEVVSGKTPLLKSGQSDWQTLREGYDKTTWENLKRYATQPAQSLYDVRPALGIPSEVPQQPEPLANVQHGPEEQKDLKDTARLGLEIYAGLLTAGLLPPGAMPSAQALMNSGRYIGILRNFGPEVLRKMLIAAAPAAVDVATGAPEKAPQTFAYNLGGELVGGGVGRVVDKTGRGLTMARQRVFGETAESTMHSQVIRDLGETPSLGMASGKHLPKAIDTASLESTFGGPMRSKYESVQGALDDELKRIQALHPGGKVTAERDRIARRVGALGDETRLDAVPREVRHQMDVLPTTVNAQLRKGYSDLDADYFSRQVPWTLGQPQQVSATRAVPRPRPHRIGDLLLDPSLEQSQGIGPESIFGQTVRLLDNLEHLGPHVTLDTAIDMQRTVSGFLTEAADLAARDPQSLLTKSINDKLRPALGEAQKEINAVIAPYMVNLQAAKRNASQIVARAGVPDAVLEGQLAAGNIHGATVDPDVLLAYNLLKQPDFATFSEAHNMRHTMLAASRLPGLPLIGETTATRSKGMADQIDGAMRVMTSQMTPEMTTAWKAMDGEYKKMAQLYNSEYIKEMSETNLDDILTQVIRLDRPNDIKALRQALGQTAGGGDMLDEVAQMWLTRRLQMATPQSTGKANIDELLTTLDSMPPQTRQALFPQYPIEAVRDTLRQGKDMVTAVDIAHQGKLADPVALQEVKDRLTPARWQRVQSDTLHPIFAGGDEFTPLNPAEVLTGLQHLGHIKHIMFTPQHYESLVHLAHTANAVKTMAAQGTMRYSPTVRWLERGGPAAALLLGVSGPVTAAASGIYVISVKGMAHLATNPRMVQFLTQGMTTPISVKRASEITGMLIGELYAHGLESEVTAPPAPVADTPEQAQTLAAPGGPARSTD